MMNVDLTHEEGNHQEGKRASGSCGLTVNEEKLANEVTRLEAKLAKVLQGEKTIILTATVSTRLKSFACHLGKNLPGACHFQILGPDQE